MSDDLGARLIHAGLITRDQLSSVLGTAPPHEGALVAELVRQGVDEDAIAGFFVATGYGPLMEPVDLASADADVLARVRPKMALELLALPVRASPAGLIIAMVAPSDRHALAELVRATGAGVLPTVARLVDLTIALRRAYPDGDLVERLDSEPPLELVQRRVKPPGYMSSTRGVDRVEARALVGPRLVVEDEDEGVVPLVRHKPLATPLPKKRIVTRSFERPPSDAPAKPASVVVPPPATKADPPPPPVEAPFEELVPRAPRTGQERRAPDPPGLETATTDVARPALGAVKKPEPLKPSAGARAEAKPLAKDDPRLKPSPGAKAEAKHALAPIPREAPRPIAEPANESDDDFEIEVTFASDEPPARSATALASARRADVRPPGAAMSADHADLRPAGAAKRAETADVRPAGAAKRADTADVRPAGAAKRAEISGMQPSGTAKRADTADVQPANAATSAKNADVQPANAATSAKNADVQAANAATSAKNADVQAANAATSAKNADVQAANAATSAKNADVQAANAATSAKNAGVPPNNGPGAARKLPGDANDATANAGDVSAGNIAAPARPIASVAGPVAKAPPTRPLAKPGFGPTPSSVSPLPKLDPRHVVPSVKTLPGTPSPEPATQAAPWGKGDRAPSQPPPKPVSLIPPEHASWTPSGPDTKVDPSKVRTITAPPKRSVRPPPIGGTLAAIKQSRDRDEVVTLACKGALTVCRTALLLALKKGVLKGWDGAGGTLTRDVVRNLWIPTKSPSMFRDVVGKREPYMGAHGTTAADGLFRAAVGSRGADVVLQPVAVGGKVVAVLAADDVGFDREGRERIEVLARAVGEAFERIIVAGKQ
jgi:hypothetical protein